MASLPGPVSLLPIAAPYDFQAFERQVFVDLLHRTRRAGDQLRLASCGDDFGTWAELGHHASDDSVDQSGESIVEARLNAVHRVLADEARGFAEIHHGQPSGLREEARDRHADARANHAA